MSWISTYMKNLKSTMKYPVNTILMLQVLLPLIIFTPRYKFCGSGIYYTPDDGDVAS